MANPWGDPSEPSLEEDLITEASADLLKVAFYNVGIHKAQLNRKKGSKNFDKNMKRFANDIKEAFLVCHADVLCLCERGEHEEGLEDQRDLIDQVVGQVTSDAPELAGSLRVVSAPPPT